MFCIYFISSHNYFSFLESDAFIINYFSLSTKELQSLAENKENISDKIAHLYRHEYGKLVAVLTKAFGSSNIELAEDVVQEAMLEALKQWTYKGVPDNPVAWIYKVAKYKAVNIVNREKYKLAYSTEVANQLQSAQSTGAAIDLLFTDEEIADDQLRMIFTCCHPSISTDSQVALTLKTLCGFSIPEIAKAFLTTHENTNKRLVRARKTIKQAQVPFEVPTGEELEARLSSVLETIYLLFNEGYNSSSGDRLVKFELCEEAIRLAEIILSNAAIKNKADVSSLLALMSLNASRFDSRTDDSDNMVDLEHQDRSKWDNEQIDKGLHYLGFATHHNQISTYLILATISAHHCTANDFGSTDWTGILALYDNLIQLEPSPIVELNRAVVLAKTTNAEQGLKAIAKIEDVSSLESYLPYYTVKAELLYQNKESKKASKLLKEALKLSLNEKAKADILEKLTKFDKL